LKKRGEQGLIPLGDLITPKLMRRIKRSAGPTPIERRLIEAGADNIENPDARELVYQHSVFCQTYLPYRNPGDDVRDWERRNGDIHLEVRAGKAMHPTERRLVKVGLPFGPKCRLVLMSINQLAIRGQSPHIEVEDSLTAFVRRILKLDPMGRNITEVKNQLSRLASADMTLGRVADFPEGTAAGTGYIRVVENLNVWFPKNEHQRVLWPSVIDLSPSYFKSLMEYAVPLDEAHIAALSHSALALDIYAWLAQRLHRIPEGKPARISWAALHEQFGQGYTGDQAIKKFRSVFRVALKEVKTVYSAARIDDETPKPARLYVQGGQRVWREKPAKGLTLYNSAPPVRKLLK
jgi:Plasmid encoded RepA protein